MSQGQAPFIDIEERESAADEYESWLKGGEGEGTPAERYTSIAFPELRAKARASASALKADPFSIPAATKATFDAAMYRDMVYCHASRGRMLALGAHNTLRESHEGVRVATDSGL